MSNQTLTPHCRKCGQIFQVHIPLHPEGPVRCQCPYCGHPQTVAAEDELGSTIIVRSEKVTAAIGDTGIEQEPPLDGIGDDDETKRMVSTDSESLAGDILPHKIHPTAQLRVSELANAMQRTAERRWWFKLSQFANTIITPDFTEVAHKRRCILSIKWIILTILALFLAIVMWQQFVPHQQDAPAQSVTTNPIVEDEPAPKQWELILPLRDELRSLRDNVVPLEPQLAERIDALYQQLLLLSGPDDPEIIHWTQVFNDQQSYIQSRVDQLNQLLNPDKRFIRKDQDALAQAIKDLRFMSFDTDQLALWTEALMASRHQAPLNLIHPDTDEAGEPTLARLLREPDWTFDHWQLGKSLVQDELEPGHLAQQRQLHARLVQEGARRTLLAQKLGLLDRAQPIPTEAELWLDEYQLAMGTSDPNIAAWVTKIDRVAVLRESLGHPGDYAGALPDSYSELLDELKTLVGPQDELYRAWNRNKQLRTSLKQGLQILDQAQSIPWDAQDRLAKLRSIVGPKDPDFTRWNDKIDRVHQLQEAIPPLLQRVYVTDEVDQAVNEYVNLVGSLDPLGQQFIARRLLIQQPPIPSWAHQHGHDQYGTWCSYRLEGVDIRFRFIPSGHFVMGSPEDEIGRHKDEISHPVSITKHLWMAETECTQAIWSLLNNYDPSYYIGEQLPVQRVTWYEAQDFATRFRRRTTIPVRLPTEAEWEYACRASGIGPLSGPDGSTDFVDVPQLGRIYGYGVRGPQAVAGLYPNRIGLYDMHGNVAEWCHDAYGPYSTLVERDPVQLQGHQRVLRGGSWMSEPEAVRCASRDRASPHTRKRYIGFRLVVTAD